MLSAAQSLRSLRHGSDNDSGSSAGTSKDLSEVKSESIGLRRVGRSPSPGVHFAESVVDSKEVTAVQ